MIFNVVETRHKKLHEKAVKLSKKIQKIELERDIALTSHEPTQILGTVLESTALQISDLKSRDLKSNGFERKEEWQIGLFKKEQKETTSFSLEFLSNHAKIDKELKELNLFSTCPPITKKTRPEQNPVEIINEIHQLSGKIR